MDNSSFEQDNTQNTGRPIPEYLIREIDDSLSIFQTDANLAKALRSSDILSINQAAYEVASERYIKLGRGPNPSPEKVKLAYDTISYLSERIGMDQSYVDYYLKKYQRRERIKSVARKLHGLLQLK